MRSDQPARTKKSRATWNKAELTFDTIHAAAERGRGRLKPSVAERLDRAGRERALLYRVLVTTGLRKGELAALSVGDVLLDLDPPVIVLRGADAKNGQRASLPLRPEVAADLRAWITEKTQATCSQGVGVSGVVRARDGMPLFDVPKGLIRILDRDLQAAGIPKCDDRGFTVDVHAMRGTFGSMLAAAGVPPVILKELMRHKRIETTLKHYVDPRLLDVVGAVANLPSLSAESAPETARATGTEGASAVALDVALTPGPGRQNQSIADPTGGWSGAHGAAQKAGKRRASAVILAKEEQRAKGLEPSTSSLGSRLPVILSPATAPLRASQSSRCTRRCTRRQGTGYLKDKVASAGSRRHQPRAAKSNARPDLADLAARLAALPPEMVAALQILLSGLNGKQ